MKKLLLSIVLLGCAFNPAFAEVKIITVSMAKLFDGYYKAGESNQRLESIRQQAVEEAQTKETALQAKADAIEAFRDELDNPMLSDDAKAAKEQEFRTMIEDGRRQQQEYQQWSQQTMNNINQRGQEIRLELIQEISKVVQTVGLKQGAGLILDTSDILGSGVPTVLFADPSLDITDLVMRELNRNAPNN